MTSMQTPPSDSMPDTVVVSGTLAATTTSSARSVTARISGDIDLTVTDVWSQVLADTADIAGELSERSDAFAVFDLTSVTFFSARAICLLAEAAATMPIPVRVVATDSIARHIGMVVEPGRLFVVTAHEHLAIGGPPSLRLV